MKVELPKINIVELMKKLFLSQIETPRAKEGYNSSNQEQVIEEIKGLMNHLDGVDLVFLDECISLTSSIFNRELKIMIGYYILIERKSVKGLHFVENKLMNSINQTLMNRTSRPELLIIVQSEILR